MKGFSKTTYGRIRKFRRRVRRRVGARPVVLIAYSRPHFDPKLRDKSLHYWSSAGQLASHIYSVLSTMHLRLIYEDRPSRYWNIKPCDLVFSCMANDTSGIETARRISFPAMSHVAVMNSRIMAAASQFGERYPEYVFSSAELNRWRTELHASDRVVLIGNEEVAATYRPDVPTSKLALIPAGIDFDHFRYAPRKMEQPVFLHNPTVLSVCKGTRHIFEAWPRVRRACPQTKLWIMGGEGRETGWRDRINQPGITFLGPYEGGSEGYLRRLAQAHFVVLPSLCEGQPGSVLEAMSCGCVPILFPTAGLNATEYGGFEAKFDSVDSLAEQMIAAASSGDEWADRSRQARSVIERRHSWANFESNVRDILRELELPSA